MSFEPIAIVGRSCILPGALTPDELWRNVAAGRDLLAPAPKGRWRLRPELAIGTVGDSADRTWTDIGGYVSGFEGVFDPSGFAVPREEILALDPVFQWTMHAGREALRSAALNGNARTGLVMGNLSFPSAGMARFAESVWLNEERQTSPHPRNRFMSGMPAQLAARALELGVGGFALDAACASSLYAIKLACDALHDRTADTMLAGAVSCADDLFIHIGFCALQAMSRSGRSRPFHREADGLLPAEGAAFVVLRRLSDAIDSGQRVLGVIRGVGLSNDGRGRGLLAPSEEGQVRAMRAAWTMAGLVPEVGLVECHATGTSVGDATEIRSMKQVFGDARELPIGSLKGNLGHLITSSGAAGLLKVLAAFEHEQLPPTLHADDLIADLAGSSFRPVQKLEPWRGLPRAAVSAFGFGGNNAHLIVERWDGVRPTLVRPNPAQRVAVVALGARIADGESKADFVRALVAGEARRGSRTNVEVEAEGLKFPPRDLEQTLPQQLLVMEAAREAARDVTLPRERTGVLVGMGCDPEVARYGARWRLGESDGDRAWLAEARDAFVRPLESAGVIGTMPNVVANRINSQLDIGGLGFTVCAEEQSGTTALRLATRAVSSGELDAALVGAVDLSHEPVHQAALRDLGVDREPGDAAIVLVLKRQDDARAAGDTVLATLDDGDGPISSFKAARLFGTAHAASGLVEVAAAVAAISHGFRPGEGSTAQPWLGSRSIAAAVPALEARPEVICVRSAETQAWWSGEPLTLRVFSGESRRDVAQALSAGHESMSGTARLAFVAAESELGTRRAEALRWLEAGGPAPEGAAFQERPVEGKVASVFTGAAAGYRGMGRDLVLAFPGMVETLRKGSRHLTEATSWVYGDAPRQPLEQLWASSFLSQLHATLTRDVLKLRLDASIGYSSGETNALFAIGAWTDLDVMMGDSMESALFTRDLAGDFAAVHRVWQRLGFGDGKWTAAAVGASVERVRHALEGEPLAHLTIINSPEECVIGGESRAVERVVARLNTDRVWPLEYDLAAHCPEVEEVQGAWRALHRRRTQTVPGVTLYSNGVNGAVDLTDDTVADALTAQAIHTLDFPRTIERAWADGVRVFVEHGPRGACSGWIKRILGERPHLVVPLDLAGRSAVRQAAQGIASLVAAGVPVETTGFFEQIARSAGPRRAGRRLSFPAHPRPIRLPPRAAVVQRMEPAPVLPSALDDLLATSSRSVGAPEPLVPSKTIRSATGGAFEHISRVQRQMAEAHREFLASQSALHLEFVRMREATLAQFANAFGVSPQTVTQSPKLEAPKLEVLAAVVHPGPKFDREELKTLASGSISSLFGPLFTPQDGYRRQVRMPEPPLLLADRVTGIDAEPASMKTGTIWTETDVGLDAWYLGPEGRMPPGFVIESGQADLLLISWLGVDLLNQGERVYRLLGCELTWHGSPPRPGETLVYDIHVDGHAQQGDVRLFFFHYDCRVNGELRLSVRHGQAGFFTDEELADSGGVLWSPEDETPGEDLRRDPAPILTSRRAFSRVDLVAFSEGRTADCFGDGFELTRAHVRTPRIASGRMLLPHEVTAFDPDGGPWRRGYLRAEQALSPDDWFLAGHFKNDPCMPGTLMFEGCLQSMAIYLTALGFTVDRDGWRFEPVENEPCPMRCRGQATPKSRLLVYEIFVREVHEGPTPTLYADILCTVDGLKAFHARGVGLRLVPDWPLEHWALLGPHREQPTGVLAPLQSLGGLVDVPDERAAVVDGHRFDYGAMLACAWGRPSAAFGQAFTRFDSPRRAARLPGPPYHFMSRATRIDARPGSMITGGEIEVEYDIPSEAWYFAENGSPTMPFCVLLEAALQPCGWFSNLIGGPLQSDEDLLFRNLDGVGTMHKEITPGAGVLRTRVKLDKLSPTSNMIITSFSVECHLGGDLIYDLKTTFGFFPKEAFENQAGLPVTSAERERLQSPSRVIDLRSRPLRYCGGSARLSGPMLLMLDRITAFEPRGGQAGLGWMRAEKDVDPGEWMFKAHFFQDPVQPGSLGLEALFQLLQTYMLERDFASSLKRPRFEPIMLGQPLTWKYRGQVTPVHRRVTTEIEIMRDGSDERGRFVLADGWLWVDGRRIYHAKGLGMRLVETT